MNHNDSKPLNFPLRDELVHTMFGVAKEGCGARARAPHCGGAFKVNRLFGGQVASQCYRAVKLQYPDVVIQTMNYKFIGPGKTDVDVTFEVKKNCDFVMARTIQSGKVIGNGYFQNCKDDSLLSTKSAHSLEYVPPYNDVPSLNELIAGIEVSEQVSKSLDAAIFETRVVNRGNNLTNGKRLTIMWARLHRDIVDHVKPHQGLEVCITLSDYFIINIVAENMKRLGMRTRNAASLHHTIQFHKKEEDVDPHGYFLFIVECTNYSYDRALLRANIYDSNREAVLTITQEAYCIGFFPEVELVRKSNL